MADNLAEIKRLRYFSILYNNLAIASYNENEYEKALNYFQKALKHLEDLYDEVIEAQADKKQGIEALKNGISDTNTRIKNTLNKLADEHYKKNDYEGAIYYFKKYIEKDPQNAVTPNIIGYLYEKINRYENLEEQIKYYEKALEINPDLSCAIRNLAFVYSRADQNEKAIECFQKLFKNGSVPDDYFAYACLKIKLKDFEEGWKYYEYRFLKEFGKTPYPQIEQPKWEGQNISDKTLLVHYEQGYGDSIQFFRYLEQVKPFAKKIIFVVQNELADLLKMNLKNSKCIEIVRASEQLNNLQFDYHIPLMSLPYLLNANIDNIPYPEGYIKPDEEKVEEYKRDFFDNNNYKIGISWQGWKGGNKRRNIPLEVFYPLTKLKNVKVYSFQKDNAEMLEHLPTGVKIIDLGKTFNNFSDTAAAIANLDLFVTSDNSVFNMAGAMGKKTYLLLNKDSEWRWFFDEEKTPWYDCVDIFKKQKENESWVLVMKRVIESIEPFK